MRHQPRHAPGGYGRWSCGGGVVGATQHRRDVVSCRRGQLVSISSSTCGIVLNAPIRSTTPVENAPEPTSGGIKSEPSRLNRAASIAAWICSDQALACRSVRRFVLEFAFGITKPAFASAASLQCLLGMNFDEAHPQLGTSSWNRGQRVRLNQPYSARRVAQPREREPDAHLSRPFPVRCAGPDHDRSAEAHPAMGRSVCRCSPGAPTPILDPTVQLTRAERNAGNVVQSRAPRRVHRPHSPSIVGRQPVRRR